MTDRYTPETKAFYALPADIQAKAEELAGPIRDMTRIEILLAIGKAIAGERISAESKGGAE